MDYLLSCSCGHSIVDHADRPEVDGGCTRQPCACRLKSHEVLDAAVLAIRTEYAEQWRA